ncbi:hypothetical protein [Paracoccus sp. ME4]|uniref:hypothetical protein n=1 Tax=Paracoccus sp. ME4 TaxID=3138066 RepID=UPI00398BB428
MLKLRPVEADRSSTRGQPTVLVPHYVTERSEEIMWRLGFLEGRQSAMAEARPRAPRPSRMLRRMLSVLLTAARLAVLAALVWCLVHAAMSLGYRRALVDMKRWSDMPSQDGRAVRQGANADFKPAATASALARYRAP